MEQIHIHEHLLTLKTLTIQIHSNIINPIARAVIFKSLADEGITTGPPKWPGTTFSMDSAQGQVRMPRTCEAAVDRSLGYSRNAEWRW